MSATEPDTERDADTESAETQESSTPLTELPPSSKLVFKVLEYEGSMTQEAIASESRLCARTVRYALGKLESAELVTSRVSLVDARQSKYQIAD